MRIESFGSLCSGVGTQEMAIKKVYTDTELKFFSEIDKYAIKSFESIHGPIKNLGDFTKVLNPQYVDFLFASTPCQDFSLAGKQKGFEGFRGSLTGELIEYLKRMEVLPKVVGFENVTGILQEKFQEGYAVFKQEFRNLGYKVNEFILNAKDYGIPQNRDRVFLLCTLDNVVIRNPKKIKGPVLKDLLEDEVDEKFYIDNEKVKELLKEFDKKNKININPSGRGINGNVYFGDCSPTLTTNKGEGLKICVQVITPERLNKRQNGPRFKENTDEMFTITTQDRHGILEQKINILGYLEDGKYRDTNQVLGIDGLCTCLNTMQGGNRQPKVLVNNYRIRKLTPLECWRLMGISDENFNKAASVNSNSQLYKQAGNGIVVDVLVALFTELKNSYIEKQPFEVVGNTIAYTLF